MFFFPIQIKITQTLFPAHFHLVLLGLGSHRLGFGGGGRLPLLQAVLLVTQPAPQLLCSLSGLLSLLQRRLLSAQALLQVPSQGLIPTVDV